ncbi:uncharacterized protein LOC135119814 [Zophobas morio]|uniref:uncharacterized protein LOC135119814 n=1 Tax=Zophobas morio TaxID=2755281 RepID=UPI0030826F77
MVVYVKRFYYKDIHCRVALMAILRHRTSGAYVAVINTHLYWDPEQEDVQLQELFYLNQEVRRTFFSLGIIASELPIVFCGDFNNVPQSLLYRFVRGYMFNYSDQEARNFNGSRPWAIKNGVLKSAYSYYQRNNSERTSRSFTLNKEIEGEPPFTTVTSRRCHTVDYICEESLREEKLTGAPCGGLPNSCQPSDHLSLMACFEFLVPRNKNNAR